MNPSNHPTRLAAGIVLASALIPGTGAFRSLASSHSDAPLIKQDPQANLTDVYAFIGAKYNDANTKVLNVVVAVHPFSDPGDGVIYERFSDDALYSIHITHPTTGATLQRYDFRFSDINPLTTPGLKNPDTILSYGLGTAAGPIITVGGPEQNYTQTYSVTRVIGATATSLGTGLGTPPPNVGGRTTPFYNDSVTGKAISGATTVSGLDSYTQQTVHSLAGGEVAFAGPREDGFYADTGAIFDLLDSRILDNDGDLGDGLGQDGGGVDGFKGFNVLCYAIQIPVSALPSFQYTAPFADLANPLPALGSANGVGVYASVSRQRITLRRTNDEPLNSGPWIQVNRLANPLFNEVLVALKDKDNYNRTAPTVDAALFATYALNPELAGLINFVFGTSFATSGRSDLAAVFIPDVIRVDTTTPPVALAGQGSFSRFGFAGGDTTTDGSGRVKSSGWPNGRRLGDDVVDVALTAIASGPTYSTVTVVGDNVHANDQIYNQVFPYAATPHSGKNVDQRQSP
jgi:hypothetical protein